MKKLTKLIAALLCLAMMTGMLAACGSSSADSAAASSDTADIEAVQANDLSIVLGETVFLAALYIVVLFLTDILYTVVDPRIRIQGGKR